MLKRIIYNYDDESARAILSRVRDAMAPESKVLLLEPVWRRGNSFDMSRVMDLKMLVLGGGRVRDRAELRDVCGGAGLRLTRVIPTPMVGIVEAVPA